MARAKVALDPAVVQDTMLIEQVEITIRWNRSMWVPSAWAIAALIGSAWLTHTIVPPGCWVRSRSRVETMRNCISVKLSPPGNRKVDGAFCTACHSEKGGPSGAFLTQVTCDNTTWKSHVFDGRLDPKVWEFISESQSGSTCGW